MKVSEARDLIKRVISKYENLAKPSTIFKNKVAKALEAADLFYHEKSKPIISDAEYDNLKDWFRKKAKNHPYLQQVGSPISFGEKMNLPSVMGSLPKLRPASVVEWVDDLGDQPEFASGSQMWVIDAKLDGISGQLLYSKGGKLETAFTRGDGFIGRAITENARHVQGVLSSLPNHPSDYYHDLMGDKLIVKGEFIIHKSIFETKYKGKSNPFNPREKIKVARNFVGGCLNRLPKRGKVDPILVQILNDLTFVAFSIAKFSGKKETIPEWKYQERLALMALGFTCISNPVRYGKGHFKILNLLKKGSLPKSMAKLLPSFEEILPLKTYYPYDVLEEGFLKSLMEENTKLIDIEQDGLVIQPMNSHWGRKFGFETNDKDPKWIRSIKLDQSEQTSKVGVISGIEWRVTSRRLLKPRIVLKKSLDFGGVEVTYATAYNAKFVKDHKLHPGMKVKLIRSGDVIPRIVEIFYKGKWQKVSGI